MQKRHRILSLLLAAAMLVTSNVTAFAYDRTAKEPPSNTERVEQLRDSGPELIESANPIDPAEVITAIVTLETQPVVTESSGTPQIRNQAVMLRQQVAVQKEISSKVLDGEPVEVLHTYTAATNGFAIRVAYGKLDEIRALPNVAAAYPAPEFKVAPNVESTTTELGGLENSSGYRGEGMVIAILDTGLEISHKSFKDAPENPALTQRDIEQILAAKDLNAEKKLAGITGSQVYRSEKVPFAFDYADKDTDVTPGSAGDHGVHVSGIAAANAGVVDDVVGVAPQAQILAMKVFSSGGSNGATWDDILAAADDAVALGADVINMSLGSICGFSTPEGDEEVAKVFQNIAASGVMLSISAGNEYSSALGTRIGKGHALTQNPDYGTVASPSSYSEPLSVASVEKAAAIDSCYLTVGDRKVAFNDTVEDSTASGVTASSKSFRSLAGQELSYVVVPNAGEKADYDGLNVQGKIALVSRGSVEYNVKKEAAKEAGAVGILVYNNEPGMLYMQMDEYDLPSAFISQADGKVLAALAESDRKLTVSASYGKVDNPTSGEMSDFSSWGVTPELTLKPDITAPGGNIKSATVNNGYTTKSGTSMSAPFVSGAMAVVKQYIEQNDLVDSETGKTALTENLLMSTADLVMAGTAPYSPRKQGAGSVNITAATSAKAYLTDADGGRPKIALGDDVNKNGKYTINFQIHNLSEEAQTYTIGGYIQTDAQEVTKKLGDADVNQVTELPYLLGRINAGTVTVAGGETETVSVPVSLTQANKDYLNSFANGTYVEGFVTLTPQAETQPTLSIPYMGFYGDWTKAPIVDATDYGDTLNGQTNWSQAYTNTAASDSVEGTVSTYLGDNPYHDGVPYSSDRNAISPNKDDYMDSLSFVYTGLLRNVKALKYEIRDAATNEVYYSKNIEYETKSVYDSNYFQIIPSGVADYSKFDAWYGTGKDNYTTLDNNTKVIVTISGELAYEKHDSNNARSFWSFPITIDTEEPEAKDITVRSENGKYYVDLTVKDNQFVSNVTISNSAETKELASYAVTEDKAGAETKCSYDITGFGENLKIVVNDYACNRKVYSFTAVGNTDASEVIVPTKAIFTEDFEETSFPPEGWSVKNTSSKNWYQSTEASKVARCDYSDDEQQNEWLISPVIDLSAQSTRASMIFDFYTNYYYSVERQHHNLKVMATTNGTDWEQIWQLWDWNTKNEFTAWVKTQAKVTIPDKYQDAESVQFAFVYEGKGGTDLYMDNIQVYVEDPDQIHTITATAGKGGKIDPSGEVQINDGKSKIFTITPDEGYFIQSVTVDGENKGTPSTYTFSSVKEDHTIQVTFGGGASGESELLIDEDFNSCTSNGTLPDGWTASGASGNSKTWVPYTYPYNADAYKPSLGAYRTAGASSGAEDDRLLAPKVDLSGRTASMSFRFAAGKTYHDNGEFYCTLEATTDGTNWTELWKSNDSSNTYSNAASSGYQIYTDVNVLIPAELQKSDVQFAFRYHKNAGGDGACSVDDVKLIAVKASSGGDTGSILLDEDFDDCTSNGALPEDWTQTKTNTSYTWKVYKYFEHLGAYCGSDNYDPDEGGWGWDSLSIDAPEIKSGAKQDERLMTPAFDLAGKSGTLTFQFTGNSTNLENGYMTVTVEATSDGKNWSEIWNAKDHYKELTDGVINRNVGTGDMTVEVPSSTTMLAFRYQRPAYSQNGGPVFVDDVKLIASGGSSEPEPPTTFTITASAGQGGSISPKGSVSVVQGEDQKFTITPSEGYEIADVKVDDVSVGKETEYTFEKVSENHSIAASFTEKAVVLPDSIHEDFNSSEELPAGWSVEGPSAKYNYNTWKIVRYTDFKSDAAVCSQNFIGNDAQNERLILPQINMKSNMELTFDFGASYATLASGSFQFTVEATKDKGQTWTTLWDAKDHMGTIDEENPPENITGKGSIAIPAQFCDSSAQFAFVFKSSQKQGGSAAVDNVILDVSGTPAPNLYGITIEKMQNGTVTANKTIAAENDIITLTVKPDAGYHLKEGTLMANDQVVSGNTFTMPAKEVTITATFEKDKSTSEPGKYKDGTYEGSAEGNNGTVYVTVTVENGNIAKIEVTDHKETDSYWKNAIAIIEKLLGLGNDEAVSKVDTVGGATNSSRAIKEAVQDALKNAIADDSGIFDSGNGSQKNPYRICTIAQLQAFAKSVNEGMNYKGKYVSLGTNLNLKDVAWEPIGTSDHGKYTSFAGIFDGGGYTVSHINCGSGSAPAKYEAIGFFGVVSGTVQNLNISVDKYYNSFDAEEQTVSMGGLVGILARGGVIDHCSVSGGSTVVSETSGPKAAVGGLVGQMEPGSVAANSWTDVGLSYGSTYTGADVSMGGICGKQAQNSLIANSASFGSVPGMILTGRLRVGGLAGQTSGAIYNCYTNSLTKSNVMGELTASGFINNEASTAVGHLIGSSTTGAALYDCYYDTNAEQVSNVDMAGDASEGKTERRQAIGWDNGSEIKTDATFIEGKTASQLASAEFAKTLNANRSNTTKNAATEYFKEKKLLDSDVSAFEDLLDDGFYSWKLTDGRVLFGDTAIATTDIESVEMLAQKNVAYGTAKADLNLPETVQVTLSDKTKKDLKVTWSCDKYDGSTAGTYTFEGVLTLTGGIQNTGDLKAYVVVKVQEKSTTGGGSGSGGSGSGGGSAASGTKYPITLPGSTANGTVTVTPAEAAKGSKVTVTVTPDSGYVLDKLMVTDESGNLLGLTNQGSGKFTFIMSGSAVTVQASFTKESGSVFADVPNSAYYAEAVKWALNEGITNGTGNGLFGAQDACTRAQIVTFLWRAAGSPAPKVTFNPFSDVSAEAYYFQAVLWAVENGITEGTGNGRFSPDSTCTRGQSVTFLYRAAGSPAASGSSFQDVAASSYCAAAAQWAVQNGITQGTGKATFSPDAACNRAQIVTFLYRQHAGEYGPELSA